MVKMRTRRTDEEVMEDEKKEKVERRNRWTWKMETKKERVERKEGKGRRRLKRRREERRE